MTRLAAGGPASPKDRRTAEITHRLLRDELARVRASALAWRNGLGGLLAGLLGFGLVRGRANVAELASPWHIVVGAALLAALLVGTVGALQLLRAANGRPTVLHRREFDTGTALDHAEALATALRAGTVLTLACAALLVTAVGITWYGPGRNGPALQVTTPTGTLCGTHIGTDSGTLTLQTDSGKVQVDLRSATGIRAVGQCAAGS
ncbi:hypothetical protein [Streptomyces sp. NPDC037389]|uniref:hypothetical protein n=1 Tax=Streptomyces sp. NPDC037389 TaxID=3155369 RepID=UPI0033D4E03B